MSTTTSSFQPRPTVYKGVQMRSRLEAGFAQWLDRSGWPGWKYEPQAFGSEAGQYLPDFWLPRFYTEGRGIGPAYVEVKPHCPAATGELADRMAIVWASEPDAVLIAAYPKGVSRLRRPANRNDTDLPPHALVPHKWVIYGASTLGASFFIPRVLPETGGPWHEDWWTGA